MGITTTIKITNEKEKPVESYDKGKFYLGRLCPNKHEYDSTGKSLRYNSNHGCSACNIAWSKEQQINNPKKLATWKREVQIKNSSGLLDPYIKRLLRDQYGLNHDQITPKLIQMKREQLQLHRALRRTRNAFNSRKHQSIG